VNLLAQITSKEFARIFDNYQMANSPDWFQVAAVTVAVIFAAFVAWQAVTITRSRRLPRLLFYDLAKLHNIPAASQRRLIHLSRTHQVGDPAYLFVCPDLVRSIESQELSRALTVKERKRLEDFFVDFRDAAFGRIDQVTGNGDVK
jgi:hypothetical protein